MTYSAFTLAVGHSTAWHGTLNLASVNGYRLEQNHYVLGSPGLATSTMLAEPVDITAVLEKEDSNCGSPFTDNSTTEESRVDGGDTRSQKDDSSTMLATKEPSRSDEMKPLAGLKRKRSTKLDKVEKAMEKVCDRMTKGQAESDKLFIDLEEKRMKLDYEMLKMEQ